MGGKPSSSIPSTPTFQCAFWQTRSLAQKLTKISELLMYFGRAIVLLKQYLYLTAQYYYHHAPSSEEGVIHYSLQIVNYCKCKQSNGSLS